MNIAIVGYGDQGRAAYDYWNTGEHDITICDRDESLVLPSDTKAQLGESYLQGLERFDLIVRSPSVHPRSLIEASSVAIMDKVTTVTNEFMRVCPTRNIIGVTGTKGKGTTSTLITKMLEADGKRVHLGGNIGIPPLDMLKDNIQPDDWVVLELANFQLIDLKQSPHIAICLMVVPEHLDWHSDEVEYYATKSQLFAHQTEHDIAIYYANNQVSHDIAFASPGKKIPYYDQPGAQVLDGNVIINGQAVCATSDIKLLGQHNWQNACAAVTAVTQITQNFEAMRDVLISFTGLEHRLELVRELDGVRYYDDSFATTPEAAIVAIQAFTEPKIVILGGSDKNAPYDALATTVATNNVRQALLIGEQADRIQAALEQAGFSSFAPGGQNMTEIVSTARSHAQPGDIVLLSTACASFDMFKNYKDRGEQFKAAVANL